MSGSDNKIFEKIKQYKAKALDIQQEYVVLLPLVWRNNEWHILYEVRSQYVSQPGDIAFPGGRVEYGETLVQAARRETVEELGIREEDIRLYGEIDSLFHGSSIIYCFIGELCIESDYVFQLSQEVNHIVYVPLKELCQQAPEYYQLPSRVDKTASFPFERIPQGKDYPFTVMTRNIPFYRLKHINLWGITARFTHRFIEIIGAENYKH